jgi:hypothetical protein
MGMGAPLPSPKKHADKVAALKAMDPEREPRGVYSRLLKDDMEAQKKGEALMDEPERQIITKMLEMLREIREMRMSDASVSQITGKVQEWEEMRNNFAADQREKKQRRQLYASVSRPLSAATAGKARKMRKSQRRKSTKRKRRKTKKRRRSNKKYK